MSVDLLGVFLRPFSVVERLPQANRLTRERQTVSAEVQALRAELLELKRSMARLTASDAARP